MTRTVGDRLGLLRRRALVGRDAELGLFRSWLVEPAGIAACYVHGPGGVGKTTLLHAFADAAQEAGRGTVWLDGADLEPTPAGLLEGLAGALGDARPTDLDGLADRLGDTVVLVDRFEALGGTQRWWWSELVPRLADDGLAVVAGRRPPPPRWTADPVWGELARVVPLRNLPPEAAASLLRARGVPATVDVAATVRATYGHPLALTIAADEYAVRSGPGASGGTPGVLVDHPDAAARLLGCFVDEVVEPLQREALHVCAHARRVDRALLCSVLGVDTVAGDELLGWLRERPYAEAHPDGLSLHDVVRDALDRDLRWRDREAFAALHRRIRGVAVARMAAADGADYFRAANDLLYLHRGNPVAGDLYGFDELGSLGSRPAAPDDHARILEMVTATEGEWRAAATAYWLQRQPEAFHVVHDAEGTVVGVAAFLRLDRAGPEVAEPAGPDPVAAAGLAAVRRERPVEPDEAVQLVLMVDGLHPEQLGGFSDVGAALSLREWAQPRLGWVLVGSTWESTWQPIWDYIGFERIGTCEPAPGTSFGVWGRDFLRSSYAEWLELLTQRELDTSGHAPAPVASPVALSRDDFDRAVRDLARDLHRPDRVASSPLSVSRLAHAASDEAAADVLVDRVSAALAVLAGDPRSRRGARAVDRTYVRAASTQERAAEVLDLPFSTYRRHLKEGMDALVEVLWRWELHGPPAGPGGLDQDGE